MNNISIIIPVYNGEEFIKRCIESILNQSYKSFEVILINDGSTDKSLELIKDYSKKYKNIEYIDQQNCGASVARNKGIEASKGKYLVFIDVDDYIEKDYLKRLYESINGSDIVVSGYNRVVGTKTIFTKIPKNTFWSSLKYTSTWGKIYNTEFIKKNKIKFLEDVKIGEDLYFNITVVNKTKKIKILEYAGYNYYDNKKSLTNTVNKSSKVRNRKMLHLLENMDKIFETNFIDKKYIYYFYLKTIIFYLLTQRGLLSNKEYFDEYKVYFKFLKDTLKKYKMKEKLIFMKGEEIKVNLVCNMFIFFRKIKLDRLFLNLINNLKIGRIQ